MANLETSLEGLLQSEQDEELWRGHFGLEGWHAQNPRGGNAHVCLCHLKQSSLLDGRVWAKKGEP